MDLTLTGLKSLCAAWAAKMAAEHDALCALDGEIGDADHGIAMAQGMEAARDALAALPDSATLQEGFNAAAKGFLNAVGASSGPLYATALMRAGKLAGPRPALPLADLPLLIPAMAEGIAQRGKAEVGQKTMIDAWTPAARAVDLARGAGEGPRGQLLAALAAAQAGAAATRDMQATLGRAARLGPRSLGHPDPGAVSAAMLIGVLVDHTLSRMEIKE